MSGDSRKEEGLLTLACRLQTVIVSSFPVTGSDYKSKETALGKEEHFYRHLWCYQPQCCVVGRGISQARS